MCGISGFNFKDSILIKKMTDAIVHRGPDAEGHFNDDVVTLGHRRLSIIDLSENGNQPMSYKGITIVFNGEIYNYNELKKKLQVLGHTFISESDTEVILHAYKEWGIDSVKKFNGMWAFCIYDKEQQSLFISRDRFGIKPLYYYYDSKKFIFASELKAIKEHDIQLKINSKALNFFFYQKYIGGSFSIFENIYKLQPAENIIFDIKSKKIEFSKYFDIEKEVEKQNKIKTEEKLTNIETLIQDSILKRLISDVPIGSFLSGGIDSSLISAIIARNNTNFQTFSIGFKEKSYNELKYSRLVAKHIKTVHKTENLSFDNNLLEEVIGNLDEPFGDSSVLPTFLLSKITRQDVTVSLSGDAADEIFGGYDVYKAYKIAKLIPNFTKSIISFLINLIPPSKKKVSLSFKIRRFLRTNESNISKRHLNWLSTFPETERKLLLNKSYINSEEFLPTSNSKNLISIQLNDINNYLPGDILKKVDIASMLNSLEVRVPFLDHRLVPIVLSLQERYKIKGFKMKWYLKKIAKQYLPLIIINRKKRGFTVPVSEMIEQNDLIKHFLTDKKYFSHNFLNFPYTTELYNDHIKNKKDNSRQLWLIFVFNYWYFNNINKHENTISN